MHLSGADRAAAAARAVTVPVKPSAANAAVFVLVIERSEVVPVCSVIAPPLIVDGCQRR